jgi:hypothetical protein
MPNTFERKVLKKICGAVLVNGQWRNRYKHKSYKLYKEMELTRNIGLRRLQRVGHLMKTMEERVPKEALRGYIEGRRPVGRPQKEMFTCSGQRR